jgi:predicted RNA-binding Zn ribbon-like protein
MSSSDEFGDSRHIVVVARRDLSLDFVNTLGMRGSLPAESLHDWRSVIEWTGAAKAMPERAASRMHKWFTANKAEAAKVFDQTIGLRETIYRLMHAAAEGTMPTADDLREFNRALAEAPARVTLVHAEEGFGWRIGLEPSAAGLLAPVLWSAADILTGPDRARVRECANDQCLWLFLDDSKNGTRRWCSMQVCGNRAKAHRHYLLQKKNGGGA